MLVIVMADVRDTAILTFVPAFVLTVRCRTCPGELERQYQHEEKQNQAAQRSWRDGRWNPRFYPTTRCGPVTRSLHRRHVLAIRCA